MGRLYRLGPRTVGGGGGGSFSALNSPSTTVYNPDPALFVWTKPSTFLDSRYAPGGIALSWASDVLVTDTGNVATNTTNLQSEIDAAATRVGHSRIRLPNGFVSNQVRAKQHTQGAYWTYIEAQSVSSFAAEGSRCVVANMASAPIIQDSTGFGEPAVRCNLSADYTRFVGIHFRSTAGAICYQLIQFAGSVGSDDFSVVTDATKTPKWMILDRCWVDGGNISRVRNGVQLDTREAAVVDSVLTGIYCVGNESHAFASFNGPGPWKFVGNEMEASSIPFLLGGNDPLIVGLQTFDIEFRRNWVHRRPSWNNCGATWDGVTGRGVKNLFELKWGRRVLIEGNVFEGNWQPGQQGSCIIFKTENSGGGNPTARTMDVTFRYNLIHDSAGGFEFIGLGFGGSADNQTSRIDVRHNLMYEIGGDIYTDLTDPNSATRALMFSESVNNVTMDHNTVVLTNSAHTRFAQCQIHVGSGGQAGIVQTNNILATIATDGGRTIFGSGLNPPAPDEGINTLNTYVNGSPSWTYSKNVQPGADRNGPGRYPAGNYYPSTLDGVGFVDRVNGPSAPFTNFALSASSPYKGVCLDGSDPGANLSLVATATAGVVA